MGEPSRCGGLPFLTLSSDTVSFLIKPVQFTPHLRIASFAVLLMTCLSAALDFSVEKNEGGLDGRPIWDVSEFLLGVLGVDLACRLGPSWWEDPCSNFTECCEEERLDG